MRILAIDMGTGTQDILLFDSERPIENCVKMVMPSATEIAARRIRAAAREGQALVLTGTTAGGGPCAWALEDYLKVGARVHATPEAAATFDDDLDRIRQMGIELVSADEASVLEGSHVTLGDLDLDAIGAALAAFEEDPSVDGFALGCLDHGAAPPGVSDRIFRFNHLRQRVADRNDLLTFAFEPDDLPDYLTRARSMVAPALARGAVAFMDTGPAAALGALHDESVGAGEQVVLNLGNMHLLGFHLRGRKIASLFEHHTGEVTDGQIQEMTRRLHDGRLTQEEVFESKGHGAMHADRGLVEDGTALNAVTATGPQRGRLRNTLLPVHFAAPFGDMMISGCFGLLRGYAAIHEEAAEGIAARLGPLPE
ncbi:MAG: DUF1786 family protein [Dehalococcoidia bacterium]